MALILTLHEGKFTKVGENTYIMLKKAKGRQSKIVFISTETITRMTDEDMEEASKDIPELKRFLNKDD